MWDLFYFQPNQINIILILHENICSVYSEVPCRGVVMNTHYVCFLGEMRKNICMNTLLSLFVRISFSLYLYEYPSLSICTNILLSLLNILLYLYKYPSLSLCTNILCSHLVLPKNPFDYLSMCPKRGDWMAASAYPDQTAPFDGRLSWVLKLIFCLQVNWKSTDRCLKWFWQVKNRCSWLNRIM